MSSLMRVLGILAILTMLATVLGAIAFFSMYDVRLHAELNVSHGAMHGAKQQADIDSDSMTALSDEPGIHGLDEIDESTDDANYNEIDPYDEDVTTYDDDRDEDADNKPDIEITPFVIDGD